MVDVRRISVVSCKQYMQWRCVCVRARVHACVCVHVVTVPSLVIVMSLNSCNCHN